MPPTHPINAISAAKPSTIHSEPEDPVGKTARSSQVSAPQAAPSSVNTPISSAHPPPIASNEKGSKQLGLTSSSHDQPQLTQSHSTGKGEQEEHGNEGGSTSQPDTQPTTAPREDKDLEAEKDMEEFKNTKGISDTKLRPPIYKGYPGESRTCGSP
eukprot:GHVU01106655.1.p2 GENE.GHVU01106655.1~~GHVU01106655.1.p2  ORF type:complete len:156 (+),score=14.81 GHVU01106655.1:2074-2541(+)